MGRGITLGVVAFALVLAAAGGSANAETLLERGTYLMRSVAACGTCHTPRDDNGAFRDGMELAGGFTIEEEPFTAHVPNITPDRETGIGSWTDALVTRI